MTSDERSRPAEGQLDAGEVTSEAGEPDAGIAAVTYRRDIQPIWNRYCTPCHQRSNYLDLSAPASWANLMKHVPARCWGGAGKPMIQLATVTPGEPENSVLYLLVSTRSWNAPWRDGYNCGRAMPQTATGSLWNVDPLAVEKIQQWITAGAKDD